MAIQILQDHQRYESSKLLITKKKRGEDRMDIRPWNDPYLNGINKLPPHVPWLRHNDCSEAIEYWDEFEKAGESLYMEEYMIWESLEKPARMSPPNSLCLTSGSNAFWKMKIEKSPEVQFYTTVHIE